jgi:hypothetical protein
MNYNAIQVIVFFGILRLYAIAVLLNSEQCAVNNEQCVVNNEQCAVNNEQ